jgi:ATP synthase F1 delta subunit
LETGDPQEIYRDIETVDGLIKENPEYVDYLVNPSIPKSERIKSISDTFEGRVCDQVFSFLLVVMEHRDMKILLSAIDEFRSMYEYYMNIADAVVTSAVELTEEEKKKLIAKLSSVTGKSIRATYVVDKDIIGGISVTVDGRIYDGAVRKNLNNLKEVMS